MLITWCVAIDSFIKLYACISKIYNVIFPFFWKYLCKNVWVVYLLQIKKGVFFKHSCLSLISQTEKVQYCDRLRSRVMYHFCSGELVSN